MKQIPQSGIFFSFELAQQVLKYYIINGSGCVHLHTNWHLVHYLNQMTQKTAVAKRS